MKVFELYMSNGLSYGDHEELTKWIVAADESEAKIRAEKEYENIKVIDNAGHYWLEEVTEIDGYKIAVKSK